MSRYEGPKHIDGQRTDPRDILSTSYLKLTNLRQLKVGEMKEVASEMNTAIERKIYKGKAYPTFLRPTSKETVKKLVNEGTFVIEVGGTRMRANHWKNDNGTLSQVGDKFEGRLKKDGKEATVFKSPEDFFDSLFDSMAGLVDKIKENPKIPLSIIFSFEGRPVETDQGLDYIVTRLSKGFIIPGMLNNSFITLLNNYLKDKHGITEHRKMALFNDTAILSTKNIGTVVGTGFNYALKVQISKLREILGKEFARKEGWQDNEFMIVNIEAAEEGIIGKYMGINNPRSMLSRVDAGSENRGHALEEKVISGKYLGESLKIILSDLNKISLGRAVKGLDHNAIISSADLSNILEGKWDSISSLYFNPNFRNVIKGICEILRDRAAFTLSSLIVGGLDFTGDISLDALVEGSLFWNLPGFKEKVAEGIKILEGDQFEIKFTNTVQESDGNEKSASQYFGALAGMQFFHDFEKRKIAA